MSEIESEKQRLDKWLFFARVYKTRSLAANMVVASHIRVNKQKVVKPATFVKIGDILTIRLDKRVIIYKVLAFGKRRGPANEARELFEDMTPAVDPIQSMEVISHGPRPTKRDRRVLQNFLDRQM